MRYRPGWRLAQARPPDRRGPGRPRLITRARHRQGVQTGDRPCTTRPSWRGSGQVRRAVTTRLPIVAHIGGTETRAAAPYGLSRRRLADVEGQQSRKKDGRRGSRCQPRSLSNCRDCSTSRLPRSVAVLAASASVARPSAARTCLGLAAGFIASDRTSATARLTLWASSSAKARTGKAASIARTTPTRQPVPAAHRR